MEKEFLPYTLALEMKSIGFDEPCLGCYVEGSKNMMFTHRPKNNNDLAYVRTWRNSPDDDVWSAPAYSQAFRWFRENYDLNSLVVFDKYICEIDDEELENPYFTYYYSINELWSEGKDYGKFTRGFINVASNRDMLSYEEAELACLKKLIQIVKEK